MSPTQITILLAGLALAPSAFAQAEDNDEDGIDDVDDNCPGLFNPDQTDDNEDGWGDPCVEPGATISTSASMGAGFFVGSGASVGSHAALGERTHIGARTTIADGATTADGVILGTDSRVGRRSSIGAGTTVGADLTASRAVTIGADTTLGATVTLGYAAEVQAGATVGDRTTVGALAEIGAGADLGNDVVVARGSQIGSDAQLATGTIVGPDTTIAADAVIASGVRIRKGVTIEAGAQIGARARIARGTTIRTGAQIGADAIIGTGSNIGAYAVVQANERLPRLTTIDAGGIAVVNGARRFPDGSVADTCLTYANSSEFVGAEAVSGLYTINPGFGEIDVYCDMTSGNAGWTRFGSTFPGTVAGAECKSGTGTFDANDRITLSAVVGGTGRSTHSGCGISSGQPFPYREIRVTDLSMTGIAWCGSVPFPNLAIQSITDSDGPKGFFTTAYYPGHTYESADGQTQATSYWSQYGGDLSEGVVLDSGTTASRYIHAGVKSFTGCHDRPVSATLWVR